MCISWVIPFLPEKVKLFRLVSKALQGLLLPTLAPWSSRLLIPVLTFLPFGGFCHGVVPNMLGLLEKQCLQL